MGWSTPILKLGLHFDLSCAPVEFPDCMFHSCDAIVLMISVLAKLLKIASVVVHRKVCPGPQLLPRGIKYGG